MDNSNRNQKIEPSLRAAMQATTEELKKSGDLATGFSEEENLWEVIILYSGTSDALEKAFPDYHITFLLNNYAILRLPEESIDTLAEFPQIIYIERPRRLFFEDLPSIRSSCITAVQEPPLSLTGKGVLVSVIDSGIDYMHPDFQNEDGSTRILALWDQTIAPDPSKNFLPPHGYALGTLFTQEQINAAIDAPTLLERTSLCPSFDTSGHGTHVTGIAAGNGRVQIVNRGVAYDGLPSGYQTRCTRTDGISKHNAADAGSGFFRSLCHRASTASVHQSQFWKHLRVPQWDFSSGNLPEFRIRPGADLHHNRQRK